MNINKNCDTENLCRCPYCGYSRHLIWVHGHGQCANCGINTHECCSGEKSRASSTIISTNKAINSLPCSQARQLCGSCLGRWPGPPAAIFARNANRSKVANNLESESPSWVPLKSGKPLSRLPKNGDVDATKIRFIEKM